jgi:hypothetical protein
MQLAPLYNFLSPSLTTQWKREAHGVDDEKGGGGGARVHTQPNEFDCDNLQGVCFKNGGVNNILVGVFKDDLEICLDL